MFVLLVAYPNGDRFYKVRPLSDAMKVAEDDGFHPRGMFASREEAEEAGRNFLLMGHKIGSMFV